MSNEDRLRVSRQLASDILSVFADAGYATCSPGSEALAESKVADQIYTQIQLAEIGVQTDLMERIETALSGDF